MGCRHILLKYLQCYLLLLEFLRHLVHRESPNKEICIEFFLKVRTKFSSIAGGQQLTNINKQSTKYTFYFTTKALQRVLDIKL